MLLFIIINFFYIINSKNVVLPLKKITIETFKDDKTINDYISYNIYALIKLYQDSQFVAFFIEQNEASFYLKQKLLSLNSTKSREIMKKYLNLPDFWFNKNKFMEIVNCDYKHIYSEVFYFNTLDNREVVVDNFKFNIYNDFIIEKHKCGIIGMKNPSNIYYENNETYIYFFDELKNHHLISENQFTILYEDKNDILDYNEDLYLGKLIIGESLHSIYPEKYIKGEEIVIPGKDFIFLVNELKINTSKEIYSETNIEIQISFGCGFIKGSHLYRKEIDIIFFEDLMKKELCKVEYLSENLYNNQYFIYSCNNQKEVLDKIKYFPPLYLDIKTQNLTFIFTSQELFHSFNNSIYFLIAFREEKYSEYSLRWYIGDIFLRKYITSFNFDSKTFLFYRNQVENANSNSTIYYEEKINKNSDIFKFIRIVIEIFMAIIILLMLYIIYRKLRSRRQLHANELEDNNFLYIPKKEPKLILLEKDVIKTNESL